MRVTILSTGGKFCRFDFYIVTRSYSSRPLLCTFVVCQRIEPLTEDTFLSDKGRGGGRNEDSIQKLRNFAFVGQSFT